MEEVKFEKFPSIPRWNSRIIVTEKIDGTNATVIVSPNGEVSAASKNRVLTLEQDNFGFCQWVKQNEKELVTLGVGLHRGEWYGKGIQCGYGMDTRKFALFNVSRWSESRPNCCEVVPTLYDGPIGGLHGFMSINGAMQKLRFEGSMLVPGYDNPEGIIIYHVKSGQYFKQTFNSDGGKWTKK